jgi:hypothetical protein
VQQQPPPDARDPRDPAPPPKPDEFWTVDGQVRARSTFSHMAEAKAQRDGQRFDEALAQLFNLNPQYKRALMDGHVDPIRLDDPDTLNNGTRIKVAEGASR